MNFKATLLSFFYFVYSLVQVSAALWKSIDMAGVSHGDIENERMSGWEIFEYGGIESLKFSDSLKLPTIKNPTDVLIEVYATSVNPLDQLMTEGYGRTVLNSLRWVSSVNEFPLILGREFCGVVKGRGNKVRDDIQIGDKVWGVVAPQYPGSQAEYVVVNQSTITRKPEGIDDIGAAGILYAGLTAWSSLYITGLAGGLQGAKSPNGGGSGKRVCILGASGGVGSLAVQMAKAENMDVTATCSTNSVQMVKDLGADNVIDYRVDDLNEKFNGQYYDIILDAAGQGPDYATKWPWKYGKYVSLVPPVLNDTDSYGLIFGTIKSGWTLLQNNLQTLFGGQGVLAWGFFVPSADGIEFLKRLVENGKMKPIIDTVYEFSQVKEAYQKVAAGHLRGKVMIKVKEGL